MLTKVGDDLFADNTLKNFQRYSNIRAQSLQ